MSYQVVALYKKVLDVLPAHGQGKYEGLRMMVGGGVLFCLLLLSCC